MRNTLPIVLVTAIVLVGCRSTSQVHTESAASAVLAITPFQAMLMTNVYARTSLNVPWSCTQTSSDGACRIEVSETNLAISHFPGQVGPGWPARATEGENTVSLPWNARAGWLVFAENNTRVWTYDGDRLLFLFTYSEAWNKESWHYIGSGEGPFYGDQGTPVPAEVFLRMPEKMRKKIKNHG